MIERLIVKTAGKNGRGVFANCRIRKGGIIEVAPVIVLSRKDARRISQSLTSHCYEWGPRGDVTALVLGLACIYNHSYNPNADYCQFPKKKVMVFRALKDIASGEEITHNYNGSPNDQSPLWFTKNDWGAMRKNKKA